jgi:hypothetical protein
MRPQLRALASQQGGLVTRAQALDAGYTERELWASLTGYGGQAGLRDLAVHLTMKTEHLIVHD